MSFESTAISYPKEFCNICTEVSDNNVWVHDTHRFHGRCIADWVIIHPSCPFCRATVDTTSLLGYRMLLEKKDRESALKNKILFSIVGECISIIPVSFELIMGRSSVSNLLGTALVAAFIFTIFVTVLD